MKRRNRFGSLGGFTLIEALLAVTIGAMLMTMVFSSLDTALRARSAVADHSTPYAVGPAILDAIEADLRNALIYDVKENDALWGADGELLGREADGLSFITSTLCQVGEPTLKSDMVFGREGQVERRSPTTEVQYVCRRSIDHGGSLELWRREDFYVDDAVHDGGIYRLVYDRIYDFKLEYVRRDSAGGGGLSNADKTAEQMRQDGWNSIEEKDVPRAVIVTVALYARESEEQSQLREEPQVFVFRRWIPLPQVQESTAAARAISDYNIRGKLAEKTAAAAGAGARQRAGQGGGRGGDRQGGRDGGGRQRQQGQAGQGGDAFMQALQNRGNRGGGGGGSTNIGGLFGPPR